MDVRDLVLWPRQAPNPQRVRTRPGAPLAGSVNPRTGKPYLTAGYAPRTTNHQLSVLKQFYDFHLAAGRGPLVNPVPAAARGGTASNHSTKRPEWRLSLPRVDQRRRHACFLRGELALNLGGISFSRRDNSIASSRHVDGRSQPAHRGFWVRVVARWAVRRREAG